MWKESIAGIAIIASSVALAAESPTPAAAPAPASSFCANYQAEFGNQNVAYQLYCDEVAPEMEKDLFPEFVWCLSQEKEPAPDCSENPEMAWCASVGEDAAKKQMDMRSTKIAACRSEFEQAFGKTGSKREELIPTGYVLVDKAAAPEGTLAPLEHDFNDDGKPDQAFVVGKPAAVEGEPPMERLRLVVALSQPDGTLKTVPVAPYWLSNSADQTGYAQSSIRVHEKNGLLLGTNVMDDKDWNRRDEYLFRFVDGTFGLAWESSGYTESSGDEAKPEVKYVSSVIDYEKGSASFSETERCDSFGSAPCKDAKSEPIPADAPKKTLADFVALVE